MFNWEEGYSIKNHCHFWGQPWYNYEKWPQAWIICFHVVHLYLYAGLQWVLVIMEPLVSFSLDDVPVPVIVVQGIQIQEAGRLRVWCENSLAITAGLYGPCGMKSSSWNIYNHFFNPGLDCVQHHYACGNIDPEVPQEEVGWHDMVLVAQGCEFGAILSVQSVTSKKLDISELLWLMASAISMVYLNLAYAT